MERNLYTIKKRIDNENTVFEQMSKQLHSNPIKEQFSKFMTKHKKVSVLDILKNQ